MYRPKLSSLVEKIGDFYENHPFWFLFICILLLPILIPLFFALTLGYLMMSFILEILGIDE